MAKLIVIIGFALSFAAGLVIGMRSRPPHVSPAAQGPTATTGPSARHSWLSTELSLTTDQREKLDKIWSEMARSGRDEREERRREYRHERDVAIADLIPVSRMDEYDRVIDTYGDRVAALDRESREAYEAAVEGTRQILTPEQRARYEDLLKQHKWGPPGGGSRDRRSGGGHRSETRPTSSTTSLSPAAS